MNPPRPATESPAVLPALVPQAHGGALLRGGMPGNAGSPGRPPGALRERLRGSLEARVSVLEEIADSPEADPADRIRAVDILAKYGLGTASDVTVDQVRDRLGRTVALVRDRLPADLAGAVIQEMRAIWLT
jgi:hypothetical protein